MLVFDQSRIQTTISPSEYKHLSTIYLFVFVKCYSMFRWNNFFDKLFPFVVRVVDIDFCRTALTK